MPLVVDHLILEGDGIVFDVFAGLNGVAFPEAVLVLVIDHILKALRRRIGFAADEQHPVLDAILHAAVGAGRDLPVEHQLEIAEGAGA